MNVPVVASVDDLGWYARNVLPRVTLHFTRTAVIATSNVGTLTMPPRIAYVVRDGREVVLGIGDDPVSDAGGVVVDLFSTAAKNSPVRPSLLTMFLGLVLRRTPRRPTFIRPLVIVEGTEEVAARDAVVQALADTGAAAVVVQS